MFSGSPRRLPWQDVFPPLQDNGHGVKQCSTSLELRERSAANDWQFIRMPQHWISIVSHNHMLLVTFRLRLASQCGNNVSFTREMDAAPLQPFCFQSNYPEEYFAYSLSVTDFNLCHFLCKRTACSELLQLTHCPRGTKQNSWDLRSRTCFDKMSSRYLLMSLSVIAILNAQIVGDKISRGMKEDTVCPLVGQILRVFQRLIVQYSLSFLSSRDVRVKRDVTTCEPKQRKKERPFWGESPGEKF